MPPSSPNLVPGIINGGEVEMAVTFGTPDGYKATVIHEGETEVDTIISSTKLPHYVEDLMKRRNYFLENGGKMQVDIGNHPECATAESDSFAGTTAGLIAASDLLYHAYDNASRDPKLRFYHDPEGKILPFRLYRRVVSQVLEENEGLGKIESWGIHDNFSIYPNARKKSEKSLATLAVTALPLTGAGMIRLVPTDQEPAYVIAERALAIHSLSNSTQLDGAGKTIIMKRDETLANIGTERIQMGIADGNVLPNPILLRYGTICWGIRLATAAIDTSNLLLADPVDAIKTIAADTSLQAKVKMQEGKLLTALQVQKAYIERCKLETDRGMPVSAEDLYFLQEVWEPHVDALLDNPERASAMTEWGIKGAFIMRAMEKYNLPLDHPKILKIDFDWSEQGNNSLGEKVRDRLWGDCKMVTPEMVARRRLIAPAGRAALRSRVIRAAHNRGDLNVDWHFAQFPKLKEVRWNDPGLQEDSATEEFIKKIKRRRVRK